MFCGCGGDSGSYRSHWIDDEDVERCRCGSSFSFLSRRHHCRRCGGVYCGTCTASKARLLKLDQYKEVRVCSECLSLAELENDVEEHSSPFLRNGGFLQKQGKLYFFFIIF